MRKVRALIVDDAVAVRRLVTDVLARDPGIEVVGTAPTGKIALAKIPLLEPDVVTLDIEMPELDGLATLTAIRQSYPRLAVIMLSTYTQRGAAATLEALARGASDYVPKPSQTTSAAAIEYLERELVPRVRALGERATGASVPRDRPAATTVPQVHPRPAAPAPAGCVDVVAVGISTGGPRALAQLLAEIPADFPVPIVIVQHMPPLFTSLLVERLRSIASVDVREATNGALLAPGTAWLAPGDTHMALNKLDAGVAIVLHKGPPVNSCRPSVDVLLRSIAVAYGASSLAVIMTGMGHDGLDGCRATTDAGGRVLAQDESTSVVWGMPRYVVEAGLADAVLPLEHLAEEIQRRVAISRKSAAREPVHTIQRRVPR